MRPIKLPGNGKTWAAIISATCSLLLCGGTVAGWYVGRETAIKQSAVREQRLDDLLLDEPRVIARVSLVEKQAAITNNKVDNLDSNVQTLIASQEKLTNLLLEYLAFKSKSNSVDRQR